MGKISKRIHEQGRLEYSTVTVPSANGGRQEWLTLGLSRVWEGYVEDGIGWNFEGPEMGGLLGQ